MESKRKLQVTELLRREISSLLFTYSQNEDLGLLTVNELDLADNMSSVKVWISCTQNEELLDEFIAQNVYPMQKELNKRLNMKVVPKLIFKKVANLLKDPE